MDSTNEGLKNIFKNKNSTSNVKTNVRHFVSNFVSEMKRKSPNAVQKWVDSITISGQNENSEEEIRQVAANSGTSSMATPSTSTPMPSTSCDQEESRISSIKLDGIINEEENDAKDHHHLNATEESIGDDNDNSDFSFAVSSLLSNKEEVSTDENEQTDKNVCDKLNNTSNNNNNNNSDSSNDNNLRDKLKNLNNLGKIKLNEFYENNKKKYGKILQSSKSKQPNNKNNSDNSVILVNSPAPPNSSSSCTSGNNLNIINLSEAQLNIDNNPDAPVAGGDDDCNIDNKLLLNDNIIDNDKFMINTSADLLLIKNKNKHYNKRKMNLGKIGRSFSETRPDDCALSTNDLKFYDHTNSDSDFLMTLNDDDDDRDDKQQQGGGIAQCEFNKKLLSTLPSSDSNINQTTNSSGTGNNNLLLQLMHNTSKSVDNDAVRKHFTFSDKSIKNQLIRDNSTQSDSSHCSSVESLLESRKADPEAILINLGFGPMETEDVLSKIPKRFLKPSQLKGIDTDAFVRQQKMATQVYENSVLGYRGLLGNPHISPSSIVAKIYERFQQNETNRCGASDENRPLSAPPTLDTMDI